MPKFVIVTGIAGNRFWINTELIESIHPEYKSFDGEPCTSVQMVYNNSFEVKESAQQILNKIDPYYALAEQVAKDFAKHPVPVCVPRNEQSCPE